MPADGSLPSHDASSSGGGSSRSGMGLGTANRLSISRGASGMSHVASYEEPNRVNSIGLLSSGSFTGGGAQGEGRTASGGAPLPGSRLVLAIIDVALVPNLYQFIAEELHIFRAKLQVREGGRREGERGGGALAVDV